jgi:lysophospholipase L1-like esterase
MLRWATLTQQDSAPPYLDQVCKQSRDESYPVLLDSEGRIALTENAACSGAKISDVASYVDDPQRSALDGDTRLVTLTVGAANLGLSAVLDACLAGTELQCQTAISNAQGVLGDCPGDESLLDRSLTDLYADIADKAPRARIVVTGYPLLFERPADTDPDRVAKTAINKATTDLNCVIERAVAAANAADVNIHYVDVSDEFARHGIVDPRSCTGTSAFIHSLLICDPPPPRRDTDAFHPTAAGYRAYADAISASLPGGWLKQEPLA